MDYVYIPYIPTFLHIDNDRNSISLKYDSMPSEETRERLKLNGWRWNPKEQVWYTTCSETAHKFALNECHDTIVRQKMIDRMPVFYRDHCGYDKDSLIRLSHWAFRQIEHHGTLHSIAKAILLEVVPEDAIALLKELYLQAFKNVEYRKELLRNVPKHLYRVGGDGKYVLIENTLVYEEEKDDTDVWNSFGLKQSAFWENLQIFGANLQPVDRIAFWVSNFRDSNNANIKTRYTPQTREDYHLYRIVANLNLQYKDSLIDIIKRNLADEIKNCLGDKTKPVDLYLMVLYAFIINDENGVSQILDMYIKEVTPKQVILRNERKIKRDRLMGNGNLRKLIEGVYRIEYEENTGTSFYKKREGRVLEIENGNMTISYSCIDEDFEEYGYVEENFESDEMLAKLFVERKIHEWRIDRDRATSDDGAYWSVNICFSNSNVIQMLPNDTAWIVQDDGDMCSIRYSGDLGDYEHRVVGEAMEQYLSVKPKILNRIEIMPF